MVQLIKINNEEDSGFFTNQFQEIINFDADSQVALVSSTFSVGLNNVVINSNNRNLRYKRKSTDAFTPVTLTTGNYTQNGFIEHMRQSINASQSILLEGANQYRGFDINPAVNAGGYFTMSFEKTDFLAVNTARSTSNNMAYAGTTWTSSGGAGAVRNYNKWVFTDLKFNNGSGFTQCTPNDNGFFGLFEEPAESGATVTKDNINYGLEFDTGAYYKVVNGVSTVLPVVPNFTDVLSIKLELGKLAFFNGANKLFEEDYDYNGTGYFVGAGLQVNAKTITNFSYTPQSFTNTNTTEGFVGHNNEEVLEIVKLGAIAPRIFQIIYDKPLSHMLGFLASSFRVSAISKTFTAKYPFIDSIIAESIEVHLVNIGNIKSYDSVTKKAQQIIAVIPLGSAIVGDKLAYSAPELMYVDLNNKFPIPTSSLTFRIVGSETGNELVFESGITLTLAVRSKKEIYMT